MDVDDPVLPAAPYLLGPRARGVLDAAVTAAGGRMHSAGACHVHYAPGSELVVRYDTQVEWPGRAIATETLVASTTVHGPPPGTTVVEGDAGTGQVMQIGVWRYPFDPALPGLAIAATPALLARALGDVVGDRPIIDVHVYRPTQRAVARAVDGAGRQWWVKVVPPGDVAALVDRHERLAGAGLPVPRVCAVDADNGLVVLDGLAGRGLREALVAGDSPWPSGAGYVDVVERFAAVDLPYERPGRGTVSSARAHAKMLAAVLPDQAPRLSDLSRLLDSLHEPTPRRVVHGDLYERQLLVEGSEIVGVVDLDDVGVGEVVDDLANVIAHLLILAPSAGRHRQQVLRYTASLGESFRRVVDGRQLEVRIAAALISLGTGPFRARHRGWRAGVRRRIDMAVRRAEAARESDFTKAS
jgi:tRNA A-37 threonylcarbamoyl transferase component Bud32